jgi:hypothetical protein
VGAWLVWDVGRGGLGWLRAGGTDGDGGWLAVGGHEPWWMVRWLSRGGRGAR